MKLLPTQEYLQECFDYDSETGMLYWKKRPENHFKDLRAFKIWTTRYSGKPALNYPDRNGYRVGTLDGKKVKSHRIIYKLIHGTDPDVILHSYGNTSDNRIESISNGSQGKNMKDQKKPITNKSGVVGVRWNDINNKWIAQIKNEGKVEYLGSYDCLEKAIEARVKAELKYGFSPSHGKDRKEKKCST